VFALGSASTGYLGPTNDPKEHTLRWLTPLSILLAAAIFTVPAHGQQQAMTGGAHDFRADKSQGDLCGACHTPSAPGAERAMGWSRPLRGGYQVYDTLVNPDFKGGLVDLADGGQASLLCLSCHDGTVASGALADASVRGASALGADLRNDHPVGFSYSLSQMAKPRELLAVPASSLKLFGASRRVECPTCHDVHAGVGRPLLRISNDNSRLCLGCHT
jgi:predicted CXXCH cytochrome family protein